MRSSKTATTGTTDESIVINVARAYWTLIRIFETRTGSSHSRLLILSLFSKGIYFNQNQIAKILDFDRTVVHRIVKSMIDDELIVVRKADTGRQLLLSLTARGEELRTDLIKERKKIDTEVSRYLEERQIDTLNRLLLKVARMDDTDILSRRHKARERDLPFGEK